MQIIADRRALHRIPELDLELPKTVEYVLGQLKSLSCRVVQPTRGSVCAFFDFGGQEAIAFRADMDALPITEKTGLSFASEHPGKMHACGHDGHTAMLLELARRLDKTENLRHNVLLVFQPGEEESGGAKPLVDAGVFETYRVKVIFGLHLWPGYDFGKLITRKVEMMSGGHEVDVEVFGKSAHVANAESGVDATAAAISFYEKVMEAERKIPKQYYRLVKFGKLESGTVRNAISAYAKMEGTIRGYQEEIITQLRKGFEDAARGVEAQYGCRVKLTVSEGCPAVMNPPRLCDKVKMIADFSYMEHPVMGSEDFSWYQKSIPGVFFFLGVGDAPGLHADNFTFDEGVLEIGADFFETLAKNYTI